MGLQHKGRLEFVYSPRVIRPIGLLPHDDNDDQSWRRFRRVMAGEHDKPRPVFTHWEGAGHRVKNLARMVDALADSRRWIGVFVRGGLDDVLKPNDPKELPEQVFLFCALVLNQWNGASTPTECHMDLSLDPALAGNKETRDSMAEQMVADGPMFAKFRAIECFAIDTELGRINQLEVTEVTPVDTEAAAA